MYRNVCFFRIPYLAEMEAAVYARHPRVSSNQAGRPKDTGGATKTSAEYHLPDYTEPEPSTARAPEEEGEAT